MEGGDKGCFWGSNSVDAYGGNDILRMNDVIGFQTEIGGGQLKKITTEFGILYKLIHIDFRVISFIQH
ncbi:hypothetical protein SDC9_147207 [bioreactor metagenome]|uniref:Uncharacterized protein n=1 Tax=bioreactor metagenome TaxID=1076179 RepID=A0A645EHE7_9ZZZZ